MRTRALSLAGAALLGFVAAAVCFTAWAPRPASAQKVNLGASFPGSVPGGVVATGSAPGAAQPLAIQGLDPEHFAVVSREPRLVSQIGREGAAQNMVVTVVSYYTVRNDRLTPIEHVHVPTGFRLVTIDQ